MIVLCFIQVETISSRCLVFTFMTIILLELVSTKREADVISGGVEDQEKHMHVMLFCDTSWLAFANPGEGGCLSHIPR